MLLLTLNMNMFNMDIDNSFNDYFDAISPDIAFIQECRFNRINEQYYTEWAGNYIKPIDSRFHLSAAISKNNGISKSNIDTTDLSYDYICIFVDYENNSFAGVHLSLIDKNSKNEGEHSKILSKVKGSNSKIICGDFNACSGNENQKYFEKLLSETGYVDLWQEGIEKEKAYYIDYSGRKIKAEAKHSEIRTFVGNRHIDYILAKKNFLSLREIRIDFRTLAFTDHCGIILDFDIKKQCEQPNREIPVY